MRPVRSGPRRAALSLDPQTGLRGIMMRIRIDVRLHRTRPADPRAQWTGHDRGAAVRRRAASPACEPDSSASSSATSLIPIRPSTASHFDRASSAASTALVQPFSSSPIAFT
jgi:hypothetical protein